MRHESRLVPKAAAWLSGRLARLHSSPSAFWLKEGSTGPAGVVRTRIEIVAYQENTMKAIQNLFAKLVRDEQGGEVLEYALIVGLIVVAAIAAITSVGTKVLARWTSLNASM